MKLHETAKNIITHNRNITTFLLLLLVCNYLRLLLQVLLEDWNSFYMGFHWSCHPHLLDQHWLSDNGCCYYVEAAEEEKHK